jgi:sugar-specific transcriptional regulator TrmB
MNKNKSNIQQLLHDLNFSRADAETYWALLNLKTVSIRKVAELSGINRGTTYEAIKRLLAAGLVHARKSGEREYFAAESPEKIYDLIRDKRKNLMEVQRQAQQIIPELLAQKARPEGKPLVKYYEDDEGIVTLLRDVLQTCAQLNVPEYRVYSSRALRQYLYRRFPQFTERRVQEGITVKAIAIGQGGESAAMAERKWLEESETSSLSSYTIIYGNKVALISISSDLTPYGVVIEDRGTADMQRLLFEQIWANL